MTDGAGTCDRASTEKISAERKVQQNLVGNGRGEEPEVDTTKAADWIVDL